MLIECYCLQVLYLGVVLIYKEETDAQTQLKKHKETVRLEAQNLLDNVPSYINYYYPGENEVLLLIGVNSI